MQPSSSPPPSTGPLGRVSSWASALVERMLPPYLRDGDPEQARQARILLWVVVIFIAQTPGASLVYYLLGLWQIAAVMMGGLAILCTIPLVIRRSLAGAGNLLSLTCSINIFFLSGITGGVRSPILVWAVLVPVLALLCGDLRASLRWSGVVICGTLALTALDAWRPPHNIIPPDVAMWVTCAATVLFVIFMIALLRGFDATMTRYNAKLDAANQGMRQVLDHVSQGLLTLRPDSTIGEERSACVDRWLGVPGPGVTFAAYVGAVAPGVGDAFEIGWEALRENPGLADLLLDQLPRQMHVGEQVLGLTYVPILRGADFDRVLVILSDITAEVERARAEGDQRDMLAVVERLISNRETFLEFFAEAGELVGRLTGAEALPLPVTRRLIHTLKGNASTFGLSGIAVLCHEIEDEMAERQGPPTAENLAALGAAWRRFAGLVTKIAGHGGRLIEIQPLEYQALVDSVLQGAPRAELVRMIHSFKLQPLQGRLEHFADQIRALGQRLDKAEISVAIESNGLRLSAEHWAGFFAAFAHVVRNAVDHGIETAAGRQAAGKPPVAEIRLRGSLQGADFVLEIADDGRGIDWDRLAARASDAGLPAATHSDLVAALFADGISTRDQVSDISGRGVGMGAVREACQQLSGEILVDSTPGLGTRFRFRFSAAVLAGPLLSLGPALPSRTPRDRPAAQDPGN